MQQWDDDQHPVAYTSRRLTPTEERYSAIERELLGVVWGVQQFRPYVYGRHFILHTDHKPLQWVGGLRESSVRVARWKEYLAGYDFEVQHIPGKENVVADWLSRAVEAYAIEDRPSTSSGAGGLRDFFRSWNPQDQEEQVEGGAPDGTGSSGPGEGTPGTPADEGGGIPVIDEMVNDKRHQVWWRTKTTGLPCVDSSRRENTSSVTIHTAPGIPKPQMVDILKGALRPGRTYHLFVGNETIWTKLVALRREERIGIEYRLVRCRYAVTTVTDPDRQVEIVRGYHVGKTHHRGPAEAWDALRRRYYWPGMRTTIADVIRECSVCARTKADTRPPGTLQEVTPTAQGPLLQIKIDTFTWKGHRWISIIDTFSKLAAATRVVCELTMAARDALRECARHYGVPEGVTTDCGTEFRNAVLEDEARRMDFRWHFNTPGHMQGRGVVERLHSTLSDHLRILHVERGLEPPEAMEEAIVGYNHSVHSVTGLMPVEVCFGERRFRRDVGVGPVSGAEAQVAQLHRREQRRVVQRVRDRIVEEKARRVLRHNVATRDAAGRVTIGMTVYRRVSTNRRKTDERYAGPYRVVAIYEHQRVLLELCDGSQRRRTAHVSQLKLPTQDSRREAAIPQ